MIEGSDLIADRRVQRALFKLGRGDEVFVCGLAALSRPNGSLSLILRNLLEMGITVTIVGEYGTQSIAPDEAVLNVLQLLAEHERNVGSLRVRSAYQGGSKNLLSKYQIEYARKLYAEGESLRSIGLIFQMPPSRIWQLVAPGPLERGEHPAGP